MRCIHCNCFMTKDEIRLFTDECADCIGKPREDTPIEFLTIPNHAGPIKFNTTDRQKTEVVREGSMPEDTVDVPTSEFPYTKEVLKAFEDKGSLSHKDINVGESDYARHKIQPWDIWREYNLNPWEADIVKRVLRTKREPGFTENESRIKDFRKIRHICDEIIAQLEGAYGD